MQHTEPIQENNDIAPGSTRAVLTLADGSTIILDSVTNGRISEQNGSIVIKKEDGQLEYQMLDQVRNNKHAVTYNTMTTPRGGQYQLRLPDGTQVWLNASSSITYPTVFGGKDREVKITGEVYFDVAKDKTKPFHVKTFKETISKYLVPNLMLMPMRMSQR